MTRIKADQKAAQKTKPARQVMQSHELLGDSRQLVIEHNGEQYTLRITANDKLILTK